MGVVLINGITSMERSGTGYTKSSICRYKKDGHDSWPICKWLTKTTNAKHTECWDDIMEQPDPDCSVCGGSGYNFAERKVKMVIYDELPHGFQGGAGSLHTTGGKVERVDATAFVAGDVGKNIMKDDLIIFPFDERQANVEFTVITKVPFHVFGNKPIVYKLMLFKSIRDEYKGNPRIF